MMVPKLLLSLWLLCMVEGGSAGTRECRCVNPFLGLPQKYVGERDFICKAKGSCFVECGSSCSDVKRANGYLVGINRCTSEVPCALRLKYEDETTSIVNEKDLITKTTTAPLKEILTTEIQPRNITRAWLRGEDFYISWSDCQENHCSILVADEVDCIYAGVCDDDLESKVGITGCEFEERGVIIQSKVLGDWIFITIDDMAFTIPEDEDQDDLNYPDYNYEEPVVDSIQDIARECRCVNPFLGLPQKYLGERDFICKAKGYCFVECGSSCSDVKRATGYLGGIDRCTSEVPCALALKYEDETISHTSTVNKE